MLGRDTSRKGLWLLIAASVFAGTCCHVSLDAFRKSSLSSQIAQYEEAIAGQCITNDKMTLLEIIASHGCEAGDTMTDLLKQPNPNFPLQDVMTVLTFVHSGGCDLRHHAAMTALRRLSETAADPAIRASAQNTVAAISRYDPTTRKSSHP